MSKQARFIPYFVSFLLVLGFGLHLTNLGNYVARGSTALASIITPTTDIVLASWMAYCAVLLIGGAREVFRQHAVHGWRKVVYWVLTFYVTASLPGHFRYILTGDTRYFDIFPWWFSPLIMGVYVLFIAFLVSVAQRGSETPAPAVQ
jgi:hypothetical protein